MNEIRPNPSSDVPPARFDDEIDLVDLALALWRRKWVVLSVALAVFLATSIYAVRQSGPIDAVKVSSVVEPPMLVLIGDANKSSVELISVSTLMEVTNRVYLPELKVMNGASVDVSLEHPKGTNLLIVESTVPERDVQHAREFHQQLVGRIDKAMAERISKARGSVSDGDGQGHETVVLGGGNLALAQESPAKLGGGGPSSALILALGVILGLFAGLFAALMANFIAAARERLHGENQAED